MFIKNNRNVIKEAYEVLKTINELEEKKTNIQSLSTENIKLCVIDDEGFDDESLRSLGFPNIRKYEKFTHIDDFANYDVILCDVDGIGKNLNAFKQGISVAEQLLYAYPNKLVYLYTGKNIDDYGSCIKNIEIIKKPITMSDLSMKIKEDYSFYIDPINFWKRTRYALINKGTSTKTIAYLEHDYVRSILNKTNYFINSPEDTFSLNLSVSKDSLSLIASGIQVILTFLSLVK